MLNPVWSGHVEVAIDMIWVDACHQRPIVVGWDGIAMVHADQGCRSPAHLNPFLPLPAIGDHELAQRFFDGIVDHEPRVSFGHLCGLPLLRLCLWHHHASLVQQL